MRAVIIVLTLMTLAAAIAALTGLERLSFTGHGGVVEYHSAADRSAAAIFGIFCGVAAHGCLKRKMYAWRMVATMLVLLGVYGGVWTIWRIRTTELDMLGNALGALGEGAKIGAVVWFLAARWVPWKKEFDRTLPNGGRK